VAAVLDRAQRCAARGRQFDHTDPVARSGQTSISGPRLRFRTLNQYEAERAFGAGFMRRKPRPEAARGALRTAGRPTQPDRRVALASYFPCTLYSGRFGCFGGFRRNWSSDHSIAFSSCRSCPLTMDSGVFSISKSGSTPWFSIIQLPSRS